MGSKWSAYYPDDWHELGPEEDNLGPSAAGDRQIASAPKTTERAQKAASRPMFGSAAARAAKTAKAKLAEKEQQDRIATKLLSKSDR